MRNNKYTKEFKDSTVQLAMNSDESMVKLSEDLGVELMSTFAPSPADQIWLKSAPYVHGPSCFSANPVGPAPKVFDIQVFPDCVIPCCNNVPSKSVKHAILYLFSVSC